MINTNTTTGSLIQQGLKAMDNSQQAMLASAEQLVHAGVADKPETTGDVVTPLLDIYQQQHLFDAAANVVKVADDTLGALINVKT
ncbi:MAG: hypothetical protein KTR20_02245 [Cellvibrionaceae bacterium]|nr:hypothetical protein [Cellvibrionaceae bacterium]